jgi:hypothetical protein
LILLYLKRNAFWVKLVHRRLFFVDQN